MATVSGRVLTDRAGGPADPNPQAVSALPGAHPSRGFALKRWAITVTWASGSITTGYEVAPTRGKALAQAWACDAFSGSTFGEFLRFARCRRDTHNPPRYGDPIMVEGRPAFFVENNRQYVRFAYPGQAVVLNAHPYDVLPVEYRPDTYRDRDSDGSPEGGDGEAGSVRSTTARAEGIAQPGDAA